MKKVFSLFVLLSIVACSNPNLSDVYRNAQDRYQGSYSLTDVETSTAGVFIINDLLKTEENSQLDFYHQLCFLNHSMRSGYADVMLDEHDGEGRLRFMFSYLSLETNDARPPYTIDTPVWGSNGFGGTTTEEFPFSVQPDGSLLWGEPKGDYKEYKDDDIAVVLMSAPKLTSFDEKHLDIQIEEFPVYDFNSRKVLLIPVIYHFVREEN